MSNRVSALSSVLRSPVRLLGIVLALVFTVELAVMFVLPYSIPSSLSEMAKACIDSALLTLLCAPVLWWVIIGPLRRIAIQEHLRSETIVANAAEGILTLDKQGLVQSCNRAITELLGIEAEDLIGRSVGELFGHFEQHGVEVPSMFRTDAKKRNGEHLPVEISVSHYPSATEPQQIAIVRDLTETKRAERERLTLAREKEALRAQQMATLAQLATGVAHEIRNPLTSIKMLIQVNREQFAEAGLPTDDLQLVEQEIRRMERSVNGLLEFARPEEVQWSEFTIHDCLQKTVQLIEGSCQQQNVDLVVQCNDRAPQLKGDPNQIQQLLLNLCLNALDAMPTGGRLTISVESDESEIRLVVLDTGEGIREDVLPRLFNPFVTSKPTGVGLGLSICQRIAMSHGGRLSAKNSITSGAEFTLTLPLASEQSLNQGPKDVSEGSCKVC